MKLTTLLPLLATLFILPGASVARAGDTGTDAAADKKPTVRRATPAKPATPPVVRRDSRPSASSNIEVRIARARFTTPWAPGAPGD